MRFELSEIDDKVVKLTTLINFIDKYNELYTKNKVASDILGDGVCYKEKDNKE